MSMGLDFQTQAKGGPGSGNFGHAGRPGKRGGSASGGARPAAAAAAAGDGDKPARGLEERVSAAQQALESRDFADFGTDEDGARGWGNGAARDWKKQLSADERAAVKAYSDYDYKPMNAALRGEGYPTDDAALDKKITDLDNALAKSTIGQDVVVYRALSAEVVADIQVGKVFSDNGFMSTAAYHGNTVSATVRGPVARMTIAVPAGTRGAYLDGLSKYADEHEVLLPRNTKLAIIDRFDAGGVLNLIAVVVPER